MKKMLLSFLFIPMLIAPVKSDPIDVSLGPLTLELPFQNVSSVYLYDMIGEESLVGAETQVAKIGPFNITAGAVVSADNTADAALGNDHGTRTGLPFLGIDINTSGGGTFTERLNIGGFASRNTRSGEAVAGLKASIKLWRTTEGE